MECRKALLLIPPHLDGALSKNEDTALAEHIAGCKICAREQALQERLLVALRDMGREEIQAPPELYGLVMSSIRAERRRTVFQWLPAAWRKTIAAAAAVLIIAGGSTGVIAGLKMADIGKMVGYETHLSKVNKDMSDGFSTSNNQSGDNIPAQSAHVQLPGELTASGDGRGESNPEYFQVKGADTINTSGNGAGDILPKIDSGAKSSTAVATLSPTEMRALLSGGMKVTSTLLKVAVSDLTEARIKAVSLAAGAGAVTQVFPEQDGGKKIVVLRLTVTSDRAIELITGLTGMGTLVDRQDESRDITSLYSETMVQYRDIQSRISLVQDTVERQQMEAQAASYKQQLDAWEDEAGKRVIMLWLEGK